MNVYITGVGMALGERILTNHDLEQMVDTSDEWIRQRTGIVERRVAGPGVATSDLATNAARMALDRAGISPKEVDCIIVATVTPDMLFPATACLVQHNLGATRAAAMDVSAACSGFMYALACGSHLIAGGMYETVVVVGAETLSRITDYTDRNTCVLFGDGAGAVVLQAHGRHQLLSFHLGADGSGAELLMQPAGGSRMPANQSTVALRKHYIHMKGREVFKFAVKTMGEAAVEAVKKAGLDPGQVDWLIPHQANLRIIQSAARRLDLELERVFVNLDKYGNMSSASIPVALCEAAEANCFASGENVVLVGFGGGLTWGAAVVQW